MSGGHGEWLDESEFDAIVVGTSLRNSIVAAALARIGKRVLHLDPRSFYGGDEATLSGVEFERWLGEAESVGTGDAETPTRLAESLSLIQDEGLHVVDVTGQSCRVHSVYRVECVETTSGSSPECDTVDDTGGGNTQTVFPTRGWSIDTSPRVSLCRGELISLLVGSGVGRYLEFKHVDDVCIAGENGPVAVPNSKQGIFTSTALAPGEKRRLLRFLKRASGMGDAGADAGGSGEGGHPFSLEELTDRSLKDLMQESGLTEKVQKFVLHGILLRNDVSSLTASAGIDSLRAAMESVGAYGAGPLLYTKYGCGELAQSFCRVCAVYGGVYILGRGIRSIVADGNNVARGVICSAGQYLKAPVVVCESSLVYKTPDLHAQSMRAESSASIACCVAFSNKSVRDDAGVVLLNLDLEEAFTVFACQVDSGADCAPDGWFVWRLWTPMVSGKTPEQLLKSALDSLQKAAACEKLFNVCYFVEAGCVLHESSVVTATGRDGLHLLGSGNCEVETSAPVHDARELFKTLCPDSDFLPTLPNSNQEDSDDEAEQSAPDEEGAASVDGPPQ